jgi:hypothetical protein
MADNKVADLPTKNAVAAEPAKSLAGTIQQVMTKAITSPSDGKVDFAQGVNHITGDPHQKSAGAADSMSTLKANAEKDAEDKEEIKAAYEADEKKDEKEKEEVKEVAHKDDEKKDEVKEGEMPQAALDALKKKQDKEDAKEEKEDDKKKEMKEASENDKEEDEEEEEKKEAYHNKDKKEAYHSKDKKDMKEADMKKDDEKEMKKEMSAKDKVKDMDMKEDVNALTEGEDLSEEFKAKAATIFESAVKAKLVEEIENLESEYEAKVTEKVEETKSEIVEKVDAYLNYVVSEWMKENELAIEKGLRNEITEDFIGGLKSLFESHYIDVPADKYNVIDEQAAEIEELKNKLNESVEQNVELNSKIGEFAREDILQDVGSDLAETEKEKFKGLAESIEYKDAADFRKKVETVKESYFPRKKATSEESNDVADKPDYSNLSESMAAYTAAISKTNKNPYTKK